MPQDRGPTAQRRITGGGAAGSWRRSGALAGEGAFAAPGEFYDYWRKFPFKVSAQVQNQLQRLLKATQEELAQLRAQQPEAD